MFPLRSSAGSARASGCPAPRGWRGAGGIGSGGGRASSAPLLRRMDRCYGTGGRVSGCDIVASCHARVERGRRSLIALVPPGTIPTKQRLGPPGPCRRWLEHDFLIERNIILKIRKIIFSPPNFSGLSATGSRGSQRVHAPPPAPNRRAKIRQASPGLASGARSAPPANLSGGENRPGKRRTGATACLRLSISPTI